MKLFEQSKAVSNNPDEILTVDVFSIELFKKMLYLL